MLKFGNKEFRNLQEQVLKNMQNIANLKEGTAVLSEFGIKVVGEVDSLQDLASVADYKLAHEDWAYGDAFAIGTQPPYKLVILTRANDEITADHWFDIGDFPMPGPKGDTGAQGETGPQGPQGNQGDPGADAGFGSILATAQTLPAGSSATATVTASGPDTAKELSFTFGIPRGADGSSASWGNIQGTLSNQTDLKNALDDKQDELVSGTNIKTINNQSVIGSGNIEINSGVWGNITGDISNQSDLQTALNAKADTTSLATVATTGAYSDLSGTPTIGTGTITIKKNGETIDSFGLNQTSSQNINISVPTKVSDLTNDSGFISGVAWGDITGTLSSQTDLSSALNSKQDTISDLETIRSGAEAGATAVQPLTLADELATKQDVILDLSAIRLGAEAGSTAVQPSSLSTVATSGNYNDLTDKPVFNYKSDIIKENVSEVIKTIYGGSHIIFTNTGNLSAIIENKIDLTLPELTWGTVDSYTEYHYLDSTIVEECYKCWRAYIDEHNLQVNDEIPLKLSYTSSNGEEITATGTGVIHSNSMIGPSFPKHQIRLANVSFPDLNISNATFRIQPQYEQIYLKCPQFSDSNEQLVTNIRISMNITEDNVYKPIDSNFIGTDIARTSAIPTKVSELTNDSDFISGVAWGDITGTLSNQTDLSSALASKQDVISDLATIRSGAEAGSTAVQPAAIADMATKTWVSQKDYATNTALTNGLATKQNTISDLSTIRSGAKKGATAVQPAALSTALSEYTKTSQLATVATSGNYNDLVNKLLFDYRSDIIKDDSDVISTIYGGSHVKFTNAGNIGSFIGNTIDLSLPELTWGPRGSYNFYTYDNDLTIIEECYKCWKAYIDVHNLSIDNEINLKLSYTNSKGEEITATGTGKINSNSMIDPSLPTHQVSLYSVSFPTLNISDAAFWIRPEYEEIFINNNKLYDSYSKPVTNIKIGINITEDNVYNTIDSNFIGADIARTADISNQTKETWIFTLDDGSAVKKTVVLG